MGRTYHDERTRSTGTRFTRSQRYMGMSSPLNR